MKIKNSNPEIVDIRGLFPYAYHFQCKKCGQIWAPNIQPNSGGKFYRGSWQCPEGCKAEDR